MGKEKENFPPVEHKACNIDEGWEISIYLFSDYMLFKTYIY